ncbi:helix-turn-helix transcriptional regulator [Streptomyces sp. ITFR-16]|uniref:helix-turn-helix domain-containing protein n=1 Tax=Streptomyces sp. ITFR-16 TaxID=3075198 RepID=UPI0028892157|nr:helix-turn-helix transcriptional regulator [Streptomyces sp. ITFR-16]WNI22265.1 helix-turn-helix transcriptional regulator [Streptomyces sp. ITFR-16]
MSRVHCLSGELGSPDQERQYASYYAAIATEDRGRVAPHVTTYTLRPEAGQGSIEVTRLQGGLRVVRYDVSFAADHRVGYSFSEDRFELEVCLDGGLRLVEEGAGQGELGRFSLSLTPPRPTRGMLVHSAGRPYRGVSLTGHRAALSPYLGSVGADAFASSLKRLDSSRGDDLYLGRGAQLHGVPSLLADVFGSRAETAGKTLLMESRVMAALALLIDASSSATENGLADHEADALRTVPLILWRERHALPALAEVARLLSMSPKRLARGFKTLFGVPPMEYHRRQCLERAADLLVDTDWTVERIGGEVGYATASNFVYAFRRRLGCTPAEYRRTHT